MIFRLAKRRRSLWICVTRQSLVTSKRVIYSNPKSFVNTCRGSAFLCLPRPPGQPSVGLPLPNLSAYFTTHLGLLYQQIASTNQESSASLDLRVSHLLGTCLSPSGASLFSRPCPTKKKTKKERAT